MNSQQTVMSGGPEAAARTSTDSIPYNDQNFGHDDEQILRPSTVRGDTEPLRVDHDQSSGQQDLRPPNSSGNAEPLSVAPQAVSPTNTTQQGVCEHDDTISDDFSQHNENQWSGPQQTLDLSLLETADQPTADSSHATLAEVAQPTPQPCSSQLVVNSANSGSEGLAHVQDEEKIIPRPPISQSLGWWTCTIIAGGTAITLAVLGFLIFLWFGEGPAGGEQATYVWRKIMLNESWPAQTITICALVVRTIAAAQAAVCTSLVAALLLERRRLPLSKAVPVSVKRGVNDGPFNLVRQVLSRKYFQPFFCVEMCMLLVVTAVSFGIQFTSTVLLSGFDTTTLVEFSQELRHNVLLSAEAAQKTYLNSYSQFPPSYALFGELEISDTPDPNPLGVSDTGVKLRSFVPFQEEQRTKLRAYTGPAFSERTQVMCMRPSMDAQVSSSGVALELGSGFSISISGTISYEETFEAAALTDWETCSYFQNLEGIDQTVCLPKNFRCTLPYMVTYDLDPLPVISLCHPSPEILGNTTAFISNHYLQEWNESSPLWSASSHSWIYLTFSTNLSEAGIFEELGPERNFSVPLVTPIAQAGEWQTYQVLPATTLNATLCFAGLQTDIYNVSMSSTTEPREPEVEWNPIYREDGVEPGQIFMGTTSSRLSAAQRGILSISDFRYPDGLKAKDLDGSSRTLWNGPSGFTGMFADQSGGSWIMCNICAFDGWAIPPGIAALFARTIHTTGRAGWAIQTFLTTYTESWYAQILPQFDVAAEVDVTFSTQVRIPRHWGGLAAALVIVIVNLICVWAITVLYVVHTRYSRQGNVWHTVSQIMSEDTRLVLEQSNQVKDDEVEKRLKADDYLVFIGRSKGSKNVSVLRS